MQLQRWALWVLQRLLCCSTASLFTCICTSSLSCFPAIRIDFSYGAFCFLTSQPCLANFCFCYFEICSVLSNSAMGGLCQLSDLSFLHLIICAEWVVELCVTRWRLCSVIFHVLVWSTSHEHCQGSRLIFWLSTLFFQQRWTQNFFHVVCTFCTIYLSCFGISPNLS